ncbi:hypothetical protein JHK82_041929 [Glycine max]|nr:hypothetical protein JHK87_041887 [Glycine soja]KAG4948746.1 hypothetical protein JHK86_041985 [Glycine max]KAG4956220.1 hypothetical protein JHK85_042600 [Glycine max]KAG5104959.1 hypothetical protein JHK82_041929 [Glycine max]KAG5116084.1 hypothetical protein JHK84_042197 [Glycine max]
MRRTRVKKAKEALNQMVANLIKEGSKVEGPKCEVGEPKIIGCIQIEDHERELHFYLVYFWTILS